MKESQVENPTKHNARKLDQKLELALEEVVRKSISKLPKDYHWEQSQQHDLLISTRDFITSQYDQIDSNTISKHIFNTKGGEQILTDANQSQIKKLGLVPATKIVLENLDWFQERFDEVLVGDNFKTGEQHFGQTVLSVDEILQNSDQLDAILLTTNNPDIEIVFKEILPKEKTITIESLYQPIKWHHFDLVGLSRAKRIIKEIESSNNPVVILGAKLIATAEPTFSALEDEGFDVFVVSLWDKMENRYKTGYDQTSEIRRNVLVTSYEQLYILAHLQKGTFWIYYDFFHNVGWDVANSITTYGYAASLIKLASRPVILGMYDVIKPVCKNMEQQHEAFALYKELIELADAVVLTSKSEHIAEYLRNTLAKDKPIFSFYRYSYPPRKPKTRLSDTDGERHLVGVTSFLGEVFEPNRIETRNSIRSVLRQKIHFHYYSDNEKVYAFRDSLTESEQRYFHIEPAIWDQRELVYDMSQFDGGWLVGDEASIFARLIYEVRDRHIRELFTLFVPNGVPTSSMTYGAAGLPVFISRQIKVMTEVYPEGCCIPLDMGEVDNLSAIFQRLNWNKIHETMRAESNRFNVHFQIKHLADFINSLGFN